MLKVCVETGVCCESASAGQERGEMFCFRSIPRQQKFTASCSSGVVREWFIERSSGRMWKHENGEPVKGWLYCSRCFVLTWECDLNVANFVKLMLHTSVSYLWMMHKFVYIVFTSKASRWIILHFFLQPKRMLKLWFTKLQYFELLPCQK